jgi:hypothetical protein
MSAYQNEEYDKMQDEQIESAPAWCCIHILSLFIVVYVVFCIVIGLYIRSRQGIENMNNFDKHIDFPEAAGYCRMFDNYGDLVGRYLGMYLVG